MPMAKILIVDDERNVRRAFERFSPARDTRSSRPVGRGGLSHRRSRGLRSGDLGHLSAGNERAHVLRRIKDRRPKLPVIVMTGKGTTTTAIEATKRGAFDYQLKPFSPAEMLQTIARALEAAIDERTTRDWLGNNLALR